MTFGSTFGRTFSPTFQPRSQAAASSASTWWDLNGTITSCVAAYQPKGAASYAASLVNLTGTTDYDATEGNAPGWGSETGWYFNGSNDYLKTGVVNSLDRTYSAIMQYSGIDRDGTYGIFGNYLSSNTAAFHVYPNRSSAVQTRSGAVVAISNAPQLTSGNYAIAGAYAYRDGAVEDNGFSSNGSGTPIEIYIGALNYSGSPIQYAKFYCTAFAIYNAALTSTQVSNLYTAMAAL